MIPPRGWKRWFVALVVLHGIIGCAGFFAPYDPAEQDRERPYVPPMRIHMVDTAGHFHFRLFFYAVQLRAGSFDQFEERADQVLPLQFLVSGARYRLLGLVPSRLHFFGASGSRIYLLGAMLTDVTSSLGFCLAANLTARRMLGAALPCFWACSLERPLASTAAGEMDY